MDEQQSRLSRRDLLNYSGMAAGLMGLGTLGSACGTGGSGSGPQYDLIATMKDRGHAVLGIVDSPPGSMVRDGKIVGSNVDITKTVLGEYGIKKFKPFLADFPGMVPGLLAKRMDICCAGLLITDERCRTVAYSKPVNVLIYAMAVKQGNPKDIISIHDVKQKKDAKLALESATTQERVARKTLDKSQILSVSGRQDGVDAVRVGRADAYLAPVDTIEQVTADREDIFDVTPTTPDMPKIGSGITFRKENRDFADAFNKDLTKLIESGKYAEIMKKYGRDPGRIRLEGIREEC